MEFINRFENGAAYSSWASGNGISEKFIENTINNILKDGIKSNFFGDIQPKAIEVVSPNYRESLLANGLNSRQRLILELLVLEKNIQLNENTKIYAPEAITKLAKTLRGRFPFFIGSEFSNDIDKIEKLYPLPIENLERLSFKNNSFDVVITCDVLEHVADIDKALTEIFRVLKPGGEMLSTHPFTWQEKGLTKAKLINGEVTFLTKPEYHGNPVDKNGSLVFTVPGWDILEMCKLIGFKKAEMIMVYSQSMGIIGSSPPYVNALHLVK